MRRVYSLLIVMAVLGLLSGCNFNNVDGPIASKGGISLENWDFGDDGIVSLNGEWEFYWEELLTPSDFASKQPLTKQKYITLPSTWNQYEIDNEELPGEGFATYRLHLVVNEDAPELALKIPYASTAYKMWVNGEAIAENGVVAKSYEQSEPQYRNQIVSIDGDSEIVIQVSNFEHRRGGLFQPITVGLPDQIQTSDDRNIFLILLTSGSLIITGLYCMTIYIVRRKEHYALFFSIFCMLIGLHILLIDEVFLTRIWPDFPWTVMLKIEYLTISIAKLIFLPYAKHLYPKEMNRKAYNTFVTFGIIFFLSILFTPTTIYTNLLSVYVLIETLGNFYIWYVFYKAAKKKHLGARITFICYNVLIFTVIHDNLINLGIIKGIFLLHVGLILFAFSQAFILAIRFSQSFSKVELLSSKLRKLNINLEQKVQERTEELVESNQQLKKEHELVLQLESSRNELLSNISHELRTPMTIIRGYVELLLDRKVPSEEKKDQYLERINERTVGMDKLIEDLFYLSKLELNKISYQFSSLSINEWIQYIVSNYQTDITVANLSFKMVEAEEFEKTNLEIDIDLERMNQVMTNLIFNAIKHTPEEGSLILHFGLMDRDDKPFFHVIVEDTGEGISTTELPFIFESFYKGSHSDKDGTGLGLAITKKIIEQHHGEIWAESELGKGSQMHFILPILSQVE